MLSRLLGCPLPHRHSRLLRRLAAIGALAGGAAFAATATPPEAHAAEVSTWDRVAQCESTGNWSINTGNGFYGGLQFTSSTWKEFGGHTYAPQAHLATKAQQIEIAEKVLKVQGPGAWPVCSAKAGLTKNGPAPQLDTTSPAPAQQSAPEQDTAPAKDADTAPDILDYTVVDGDTLTSISEHLHTTWQQLHDENRDEIGDNPHLILPGQHLTHAPTTTEATGAEGDIPAPAIAPAAGKTAPVDGGHISATWGQKGGNWSSGRHTGIDYAVAAGTPVHAVTVGTVISAGPQGAYGTTVTLKHPDGHYTLYAHLSKTTVTPGQMVTPGHTIGHAGATGNTTGPHLHFEVRTTNTYGADIDPAAYLSASNSPRQ